MTDLTNKEMWEAGYKERQPSSDLQLGWRHQANTLISRKLHDVASEAARVLEVGAGDSQWLPYLAKTYPHTKFDGLDYSTEGCALLAQRVARDRLEVNVAIHNGDLFSPAGDLVEAFDLVISFGVVEHFTDLTVPLRAKRALVRPGGHLFTLIPNLAGVLGYLARSVNPTVYGTHNPHDLESFLVGHQEANLDVVSAGYLGSVDFSVLSSCVEESRRGVWQAYVLLTRMSKALAFMERHCGSIPATRTWSPYIYSISRRN